MKIHTYFMDFVLHEGYMKFHMYLMDFMFCYFSIVFINENSMELVSKMYMNYI